MNVSHLPLPSMPIPRREAKRFFVIAAVLVVTFLWTKGLGFKGLGSPEGGLQKVVVAAGFALVMWLGVLTVFRPERFPSNWYQTSLYWLIGIVLLPILLVSIPVYGQPLSALWRRPFFFAGFLLFPVLVMSELTVRQASRLFYAMVGLTLAVSMVLILGYFFPAVRQLLADPLVSERYGTPRLGVRIFPNLTRLVFYYFVAIILHATYLRHKAYAGLVAMGLMFLVIFVWGTRQTLVGIGLTLMAIWLLRARPKAKLVSIYLLALGIAAVVVFFPQVVDFVKTGYLGTMLSSTEREVATSTGTYGIRVDGMFYYFGEWMKTNFIGFGMTSATQNINNPITQGLHLYRYNLNDLGFLDAVFRFGFPALVFVLAMLFRIMKDLGRALKEATDRRVIYILEGTYCFVLGEIVILPGSKAFFFPKYSLFYGLLLYLVWRFSVAAAEAPAPAPEIHRRLR